MLLVESNARSTAFAVASCVLDSYVRGMWAAHVADEALILRFLSGRYEPTFESAVQNLRKLDASSKLFEMLRCPAWKTLNDYVHGGHLQMARWLHPERGNQPCHSDPELVEVLQFVDVIALLGSASLEGLSDRSADAFVERLEYILIGVQKAAGGTEVT